MTATTTIPSPTELSILQSNHMTATVTVQGGERYTVVARPNAGVVLIHDTKGWVCQGKRLSVIEGKFFLFDHKGRVLARSTWRITHIYIATN